MNNESMTLETFARELARQTDQKRDFLLESEQIEFSVDAESPTALPVMTIEHSDNKLEMPLNKTARAQLAQRTNIPKKTFDRLLSEREYHEPLELMMNRILKHESKPTLVRTLDLNVRALLSDRYRRIDNFDIMNTVMPVFAEHPELEMKSRSQNLSDDYLHFQVTFPRLQTEITKGDVVTSGLVISNSEVGRSSFKVEPLVFRLVCNNGMISATAMKKYHVGSRIESSVDGYELLSDEAVEADDRALMLKVRDIVRASLNSQAFERQVDLIRRASGIDIPRPVAAVREVTKSLRLGESSVERLTELLLDTQVAGVAEAGTTAWGLVNAITAFAKEADSYDKQVELERAGGKLLALPERQLHKLMTAEAA